MNCVPGREEIKVGGHVKFNNRASSEWIDVVCKVKSITYEGAVTVEVVTTTGSDHAPEVGEEATTSGRHFDAYHITVTVTGVEALFT